MVTALSQGSQYVCNDGQERWLTIGEASQIFKVHPNSLRNWTRAGLLRCYRLRGHVTGHRRFRYSELVAFLSGRGGLPEEIKQGSKGEDDSQQQGSIPIALVARCSTLKQKEDLQRQVERLEAYIQERWGNEARVTKYVRTASGLNYESEGFIRLVADICSGKFRGGFLVVTYKERLIRFGFRLVEQICTLNGVTIICTEKEESKDEQAELVDDLLSLTHVYSCRSYGRRAGKHRAVKVPEDVQNDVLRWHSQGFSQRWILTKLKKEKRDRDEQGKPFSVHIIRRLIKKQGPLATPLLHSTTFPASSNSFAVFFRERVRLGSEGNSLTHSTLIAAYRAFCTERSLVPANGRTIAAYLKSHVPNCPTENAKGERLYSGLWIGQQS